MTRAAANGGAPTRGRELRARGQRTLARILDAGAVVFADRGYHAARVDDIVKAAEVSHGTFYLYFSSKQDLFRAIAEGIAAEMVALAKQLPSLGREDEAAFRDWLERFHALYEQHGRFLKTWTEAEITDSDLGRTARDLVTEFSRQLATRVRAADPGLDPRLDPGAAAFVAGLDDRADDVLRAVPSAARRAGGDARRAGRGHPGGRARRPRAGALTHAGPPAAPRRAVLRS